MTELLQETADRFESAYIQNGGLLLAVVYDPETDTYIINPDFEGLSGTEQDEILLQINSCYEGFKLACVANAVQSIAQTSPEEIQYKYQPETQYLYRGEEFLMEHKYTDGEWQYYNYERKGWEWSNLNNDFAPLEEFQKLTPAREGVLDINDFLAQINGNKG